MNTQTQTVLPLETEPAAPAPDEASPVEAAILAAEPAPEAEAAGDAAEAPADAEPAESTPLIRLHEQLEEARSLIEVRFSEAGARLAGALDMVGNLIASLEGLGAALDSSGSGGTTKDLLATADALRTLPRGHEDRVRHLSRLRAAGSLLRDHVGSMRGTLRYLRAFAVNVKITASASTLSWAEFSGFAEDMSVRIDAGESQLRQFADELSTLDAELADALRFEQGLGQQFHALLPAVPDRLASDVAVIGRHHEKIADVAASVAAIARQVRGKVAQALGALQIGDITRQRIEHVQFGLELLDAGERTADLSVDERSRLRGRVLHLLSDQLADTASDFEVEAAKVTQSLSGMAQDTGRMLMFDQIANDAGRESLRQLEASLDSARLMVGDVHDATINARRISQDTVTAIDALARRVGAIHQVKKDIQQLTINSSLRCSRLGDPGKPLNVIAHELAAHAGQLEAAANLTLDSLNQLSEAARFANADETVADFGGSEQLGAAAQRLRQAADLVEHDLPQLKRSGHDTAWTLADAADRLRLKEGVGDALHTVAIALAEAAGPRVENLDGVRDELARMLDAVAARYTMARERTVHAGHALDGEAAPAGPVAEAVLQDDDDILF